jgi:hypothetical protein
MHNITVMKTIYYIIIFFLLPQSVFSFSSEYSLLNRSRQKLMYNLEIDEDIYRNKTAQFDGKNVNFKFITPINKQILDVFVPEWIRTNSSVKLFSITSDEDITVEEIFSVSIKEIFIYDYDGNLILMKDDLINILNEKSYEDESKAYYWIKITDEHITDGKIKYANYPKVNNRDFCLAYFDFLEMYYLGYSGMIGVNTSFSNNIFGIGFYLFETEFIPIPYIHVGLSFFNFDWYFKDDESKYFLFYCKPTLGFHFPIKNDVKIYVDGIIKLGGEFVQKDAFFYFAPGFSVNILYKEYEFKYTFTYNSQFGYMNQLSISWTMWPNHFRYKKGKL